jgi:inosine-uridine nucleoside N-ribohydrolase
MTRKVIIDCAPGIDDAFALTLALFDPRLEVVAVTATEGHVAADKASRNVQAIIDSLDPPRLPRVGAAAPLERPPEPHILALNGDDGLGNTGRRKRSLSTKSARHPNRSRSCVWGR